MASLLAGSARANAIVHAIDGVGSIFSGGLSVTAMIQTHGDSTSTGGGTGSGGISSLRGSCLDYTVSSGAETWLCSASVAPVDWGFPAWSPLGVTLDGIDGFLQVQDSVGAFPVSVSVPTGLPSPFPTSVPISGTVNPEVNAIRVVNVNVPAAVFDLAALGAPDGGPNDPGPGPWGALASTQITFRVDWCATYSAGGVALGTFCTVTDVQRDVPVRYRLERGRVPGEMAVFSADFGPITLALGASPKHNAPLAGCEFADPVFGTCLFNLTSVDVWISSMSLSNLLGHFQFRETQFPIPNQPECNDLGDDDGDTAANYPFDTSCAVFDSPSEVSQCSDFADNDGDGPVDHPADPSCEVPWQNDESAAPPAPVAREVWARHAGALDPRAEGFAETTTGCAPPYECRSSPVHYDRLGREQSWLVVDDIAFGLHYYASDPGAPVDARAAAHGWTLRARLRVTETSDAVDPGVEVMYGDGAKRFRMDFGSSAAGDPIVALGGGPPVPALTGLGAGYHSYELVYSPVTGAARLRVDGADQGLAYTGESSSTDGVQFGSGTTAGLGAADYALVEWQVDTTECSDGEDNDGDGQIDLADGACGDAFGASESPCSDGRDNDGDGRIDFPEDPGCTSASDDSEREASLACDDGLDEDGDGRIDYPSDPGCSRPDDRDEANPTAVAAEHVGAVDPLHEGWSLEAGTGTGDFFTLVAPGLDARHPAWTIGDSADVGVCDSYYSATPGVACATFVDCPGRVFEGNCEFAQCVGPSADWGKLCAADAECADGSFGGGCISADPAEQRARYFRPLAGGQLTDAQERGWIVRAQVDVMSVAGQNKAPDTAVSVGSGGAFGVGRTATGGASIRMLPSGTIGTLPNAPGARLFELAFDPARAESRLSIDGKLLAIEPGLIAPGEVRFGADGVGTGRADYALVQLVLGQAPSCPGNPNPPPGADSDGDGLADSTEQIFYHSDPCLADSDGDGLSDPEEVLLTHTDPSDPDTDRDGTPDIAEDADGDGLSNGDEVHLYRTNPLLADTDADGLDDSVELATTGTDPLVADSDGDGLTDGAEVNLHGTDPLVADSDGDGLSDGSEVVTYGTNPLAPDTDGDHLSDYDEVNVYGTDPLVPEPNADGDDFPDLVDNCDWVANDQSDANGDGFGDACTCGDLDGDGTGALAGDIALLRAHLADPAGTPLSPGALERCAVTRGSSGCNVLQAIVMRRALAAQAPSPAPVCAAAAPAPTTPAAVAGLALWLDAADPATVSTDGQGRRIWADKGPNALDVMAPSAAASPSPSALGGLPALGFDGQDDVMCAAGALDLSAGATFFVVARNDLRKDYNGLLSLRAAAAGLPTAGEAELELYWQVGSAGSGNLIYTANRGTATSYFGRDNLAPPAGQAYLATVEVPSSSVAGRIAVQGAGGANSQSNGGTALLPDAAAQPCVGYGVGNGLLSANLLDGDLAEVVVFARVLTIAERAAIERYLANKWSTRFEPAPLASLALWLDADDASTLQVDPNDAVVAWTDKSAHADLLSAAGANARPLRVHVGNQAPRVVFDGSDDFLCGSRPIDLSAAGNPGGVTYFLVSRNRVRKSFNGIFSLRTGSSVDAVQEIYWQTGTTDAASGHLVLLDDRGGSGNASVTFTNAPPPVNTLGVFLMQISSPTTVGLTRINGVALAPSSKSSANLLPSSAAPPCVGYGFGATPVGNTLDGEVDEILVFDDTLSAASAGLVESYLLRKWGLQ